MMMISRTLFRIVLFFLFVKVTTINSFTAQSEWRRTTRSDYSQSTTTLKAGNEGTITVSRSEEEHQLAYRIIRPMSLSSQQAAPIVALHGGPSVPSNYLYPLEQVIPYRSIVFYDQLGCGKSDEPKDISQYSIEDSVQDLKKLLKQLGIRRFHLYGQSYGGILAFEYMKHLVSNTDDNDDEVECLSAVLSSAPTNVKQIEEDVDQLLEILKAQHGITTPNEEEELNALFQKTHQCRMEEMPTILADAYANAGTVWRGTDAIADYVATPLQQDDDGTTAAARRMPSSLILRGEYDFVSEESIQGWKLVFNTPFLRYKTLEGCSHHGLLEKGTMYGEILDSYFGEYD